MSLRGLSFAVIIIVGLVLLTGCESSRTLKSRSELQALPPDTKVKILCRDSLVYDLETVALRDSTLFGTGIVVAGETHQKFSGTIPLLNIRYIQSTSVDMLKTFVAIGTVGFVGGTALSYFSEGPIHGLSIATTSGWYNPRARPPGGGPSCPYVYSWDGTRYVLDGEAYGAACGKALEMETVTVLPSLRPENGVSSVQLTNERPETHYYNALSMEEVEVDKEAVVVADPGGALWPVYRLERPGTAVERGETDVLAKINAVDGNYWESLSDISPGSKFEDEIQIVFPVPAGAKNGTFVVRAISTRIFDTVLNKMSELLGDDYLAFVRAAEEDPDLVESLKEWTADASLRVAVWDGGKWKPAGVILLEGTAVPFTRGVRIDVGDLKADSVRLRLTCLADFIKIDGVGIDWTDVKALHSASVKLLSALGPDERNVVDPLSKADDQYVTILPGQRIDCRFEAHKAALRKKTVYALKVQGYLHEWPSTGRPVEAVAVTASMAGAAKIAYMKTLLRMRSVLLPLIYAEWKQYKSQLAGRAPSVP